MHAATTGSDIRLQDGKPQGFPYVLDHRPPRTGHWAFRRVAFRPRLVRLSSLWQAWS